MAILAINGGKPVRDKELPNYSVMGEREAKKAYNIVKKGVLSDYLGCWGDNFFGGEEVQAFEREWAKAFEVKHAITVNSNSTGLFCALGAVGVGLEDEVIVTSGQFLLDSESQLQEALQKLLEARLQKSKKTHASSPHIEHEHTHLHEAKTATEFKWTCSIHPMITEDGPGSCPICGLELIKNGNEP